ncbi:MAG: hypothetical protein IKZ07_05470 [Akkermansia sp.]|nr:hypothetical protein [Akkermansia sp.]
MKNNGIAHCAPTAANLAILKEDAPSTFYSLFSDAVQLHLLLGKGRTYEESCMYPKSSNMPLADASDKTERLELFNAWVANLQRIADSMQPRENLVLITGWTIEDAVHLYSCGFFEAPLLERTLSRYCTIQEAIDQQISYSQDSDQIKHVHVLIAECPEYAELLKLASKNTPQNRNSYNHNCGTFFINENLSQILNECQEFCHAHTISH